MLEYLKTEINTLITCSAIGGAFSFLVGGVDLPISSLLVLICLDYFTGWYAGWTNRALSSQTGFHGLGKKMVIISVVAIANLLDNSMFLNHTLRNMMIFGYSAMEGLSIFENFDRIGWGEYIPTVLRSKLLQIRDEKGIK